MKRGAALPRLREWRIKRGLTQEGLGKAAGVSLATVNRLERLPDARAEGSTGLKLARVLGVDLTDLMGGRE